MNGNDNSTEIIQDSCSRKNSVASRDPILDFADGTPVDVDGSHLAKAAALRVGLKKKKQGKVFSNISSRLSCAEMGRRAY